MSEKPSRIWAGPYWSGDKSERSWSDEEWFVTTEPGDPEDEWVPAARIEELERENALHREALQALSDDRHLTDAGLPMLTHKARADRLAALLKEAVRDAYAIGVYDQQASAEKLDPEKTFPLSGAARIAAEKGETDE